MFRVKAAFVFDKCGMLLEERIRLLFFASLVTGITTLLTKQDDRYWPGTGLVV